MIIPLPGPPEVGSVQYRVLFYGLTPAFVSEARAVALFSKDREPRIDYGSIGAMYIPKIIGPATALGTFTAEIFGSQPRRNEYDQIKREQMFVHLEGAIRYKDIFGIDRETTFHRRWDVSKPGVSGLGEWVKCGSPEENRET